MSTEPFLLDYLLSFIISNMRKEYEKDRCRIANAYIRGGRIANPTEQKINISQL